MTAASGKGRLSIRAQIRAFIQAAPGGECTCPQVQAAFPGENIGVALGSMWRQGQLTRRGEDRRYIYRVARDIAPRTMGLSREEMRERRKELGRQRYADRSPQEHQAYLAAKRAAHRASKPATAPRRAPRRQHAAVPAAPVARAVPRPRPMLITPPSPESYTAPPPAPKPRAETVPEWMARTGLQPEKLQGFERVQPYTRQPVRSF